MIINVKRLICFVESCHFTSVVHTVVLLYQSQSWISRVNIINYVQYGGSNNLSKLLPADNNETRITKTIGRFTIQV